MGEQKKCCGELLHSGDDEIIRERITEMLGRIEDQSLLKRIYKFVQYIYIHRT